MKRLFRCLSLLGNRIPILGIVAIVTGCTCAECPPIGANTAMKEDFELLCVKATQIVNDTSLNCKAWDAIVLMEVYDMKRNSKTPQTRAFVALLSKFLYFDYEVFYMYTELVGGFKWRCEALELALPLRHTYGSPDP
jgi:hypothetical protein